MISLLSLCVPLIGLLILAAAGVVYWNDPENKVVAGVIAGLGLVVFLCTLAGVAFLFLGVPSSMP